MSLRTFYEQRKPLKCVNFAFERFCYMFAFANTIYLSCDKFDIISLKKLRYDINSILRCDSNISHCKAIYRTEVYRKFRRNLYRCGVSFGTRRKVPCFFYKMLLSPLIIFEMDFSEGGTLK